MNLFKQNLLYIQLTFGRNKFYEINLFKNKLYCYYINLMEFHEINLFKSKLCCYYVNLVELQ